MFKIQKHTYNVHVFYYMDRCVKEHITGLLASEAYSDMSFCFILFFIVKVNKGFLMLLWQLLHPFNEFHSFNLFLWVLIVLSNLRGHISSYQ